MCCTEQNLIRRSQSDKLRNRIAHSLTTRKTQTQSDKFQSHRACNKKTKLSHCQSGMILNRKECMQQLMSLLIPFDRFQHHKKDS